LLFSSWPPQLYRSTEVLLDGPAQANTNTAIGAAFDAAADCATGVPGA
jgi:hypothetical protein